MYKAREDLQRKYQMQIKYDVMKRNFTYSPTNTPSALPRVSVIEINSLPNGSFQMFPFLSQ